MITYSGCTESLSIRSERFSRDHYPCQTYPWRMLRYPWWASSASHSYKCRKVLHRTLCGTVSSQSWKSVIFNLHLLCDHFKALELAVFRVEFQKTFDVILRDKEAHTAVVIFIVLFCNNLFELVLERGGVKVNVREMRTISNKVLELPVVNHLGIVDGREISLWRES